MRLSQKFGMPRAWRSLTPTLLVGSVSIGGVRKRGAFHHTAERVPTGGVRKKGAFRPTTRAFFGGVVKRGVFRPYNEFI